MVLTGGGNDAATGATAVHHLGGIVIACSIASSTQPAMPQAVMDRGGIVQHIVALDQIAGLLIALTTAPGITGAGADQPCPAQPGV